MPALLLLLLAIACHRKEAEAPPVPSQIEGPIVAPGAAVDPVAALGLQIRANGGDGVVPTQISFVTAQPLFAKHARGEAAPLGTEVSLEPAVPGELRVDAADALVFVPRQGFRPSTKYLVEVRSFGEGDSTVTPPEPWKLAFETPPFAYVRTMLRSRDDKSGRLVVDVELSAAVEPRDVASHLSFTVDGRAVRATLEPVSDAPNLVQLSLWSRLAPETDGELAVSIAEGVRWTVDPAVTAGAANETVKIGHGPAVAIRGIALVETASGFHLDVACDDNAAPGAKRSFYDRSTWEWYENLSSRCVIADDTLAAHVRTSPPSDLQVSPTLAGFRLSGAFARGPLHVAIDAGATTIDGGVVMTGLARDLDVPARTPTLSFLQAGRYLPRSAWTNLGLRHLNTPTVSVVVRHVRPENLVFWMTGNEAADDRTSEIVASSTIALAGVVDEESTSYLDVASLVPDPTSGLYEITVSDVAPRSDDDEMGYRTAAATSARLALTDLQLVAKAEAPPAGQSWPAVIDVWALDAHSTAGVGGVSIQVVRASGQSLGECTTAATGGCTVPVRGADLDPSPPMALLARKGGDLTFLELADLQVENTAADVSGLPYTDQTPYRAAVLTDRGVIRPGETLHVTTVVRDAAFLGAEGVPVVLKVVDPRNREIRKLVATTNAAGMIVNDVPTGDYASTGRYRVSAQVSDVQVGEATFQVEEFVPERMKVTATTEHAIQLATDPAPVKVEAHWLFGGKASGAKTELRCRIEPTEFAPAAQKGFHFGPAGIDAEKPRPITLDATGGTLDAEGTGTFTCPPVTAIGSLGPAMLLADAAVLEGESGRTTVGQAKAMLQPEPFAIGLQTGTRKARRGEPIEVKGIVTDWEGKPVATPPADLAIEVYHLEEEFSWWWDDESDDSRQTRLLRRSRDERRTVPTNGKAAFTLSVTPSGDSAGTLVVVRSGQAMTELYVEGSQRSYYWDDYGQTVDATPKPARPTPLAIEAPERVEVGGTVEVSATAPYRGRMLWTAETDEVLEKHWVDVEPGPVSWSFAVRSQVPNVYVSAFLVKDPHLESKQAFLPDRAYGMASVTVTPTSFLHALTIHAPDEVRPYSPLEVQVDLGPLSAPAYVTVAAVDEGVLQLTKFEDPDPTKAIFAKRALGVASYETIGWTLLSQPVGASSRTGGDAAGGTGRVQMVKPVALWSGLVEVPTSGKATVRFDVPGYRGQLRVMAVSADHGHVGHASKAVTVRDPLVLETTLPRFLVTGDRAWIPVMVSNMSGSAQDVTVKMEVTALELGAKPDAGEPPPAPIEIVRAPAPAMHLEPGASSSVVIEIAAKDVPGAAHVRVTATAGSLVSKEELDLPIIPDAGTSRVTRTVRARAGENLVDVEGFLPGSDTTTVWVTANPYADALVKLRDLVRYPNGCLEQTSSMTRPLLYVGNLIGELDPNFLADGSVEQKLQAGLDRIVSLQTPSGGFSLWPGGSEPILFGTAYATHILYDAKQLGYRVSDTALADASDWLDRNAQASGGFDELGVSRAYLYYVLAHMGKPHNAAAQALLNALPTGGDDKLVEERMLLHAALYAGGDQRFEKELKRLDVSPIKIDRRNDWSFYSDLRRRGMTLAVYEDLFGNEPNAVPLADLVADQIRGQSDRGWVTQELGWGITGLGKFVQKPPKGIPAPTLRWDDRPVALAKTRSDDDWAWQLTGATRAKRIVVDVPAAAADRLSLVTTTEGVQPTRSLPVGGSGLALEREVLDAKGQSVDLLNEHVGDLLFVRLTLTNQSQRTMENLALTDAIPAGWEIENPRLGRGSLPEWAAETELWELDYMEVEDDAYKAFGKLDPGEKGVVVYAARAVTAGRFALRSASAEAMYDPRDWARTPAWTARVHADWARVD